MLFRSRGRNITIGAVIGFLLSCTAVMGTDEYLWIRKNDGEEIKFSTDSTTGTNGGWKTENPYNDNNWDKDTATKTYTNNIELSSNATNGSDGNKGISHGLRLKGELTGVNFINNGSITGEMSGSGDGYGIYNESAKMGNIENTGKISGTGKSAGYGILNSAKMRNIENKNKGTISGVGGNTSGNGYGIDNRGTIEDITNAGTISGTGATSSSIGIGIDNIGTIGEITNTGEISGSGNGSEGYGIYNRSSMTSNIDGKITNVGVISGTGKSAGSGTGSGIYNRGTIGEITNTGEISGTGKSEGSGDGEGYGIYNKSEDNEIGKIINTGIISGTGSSSSGNGTGSGIYNYKSEMENITNAGLISGTDRKSVV